MIVELLLMLEHIHHLHSDEVLKKVFPNKMFSVIYERNINLNEIVVPYLYPKPGH